MDLDQENNVKSNHVQFNIDDLSNVIKLIDTKKSFKRHFHWKYSPILAQKILIRCLNCWCKESDNKNWAFLCTTLQPVLKNNKKCVSEFKSYRPIASSTTECWLFEKMIKKLCLPYFDTLPEQFGYKKAHNTSQCLTIVKQLSKVDDVHVALLDASAAFDTISHRRILDCLIDRKVPQVVIRLIISLLRNTHFNIKWFGQITQQPFYPLAGVKQG